MLIDKHKYIFVLGIYYLFLLSLLIISVLLLLFPKKNFSYPHRPYFHRHHFYLNFLINMFSFLIAITVLLKILTFNIFMNRIIIDIGVMRLSLVKDIFTVYSLLRFYDTVSLRVSAFF